MSEVSKIALALSKAQAKIQPPEKNRTVEVKDRDGKKLYEFDYADYNAIIGAIRGPLSENEIALTHTIENEGGQWLLVTRLVHSSGEELRSIYPLPDRADAKTLGGAITYGKRYCLSAITGCVADDDIDAETDATQTFKNKPVVTPPVKPNSPPVVAQEQRVKPNSNTQAAPAPSLPLCGKAELDEITAHKAALGLTTDKTLAVLMSVAGTTKVGEIPLNKLGQVLGAMEEQARLDAVMN